MKFREITSEEIKSALINLRQITFEVTDICNLRCRYCGYGDLYWGYDKRETGFMNFAQAKTIIDYLAEMWRNNKVASYRPKTYFSFYGGEPLLNMPLIKQIIEYTGSLGLNRNIKYSMTTNAMLLDKYSDYLADKKFSLLISLDGDKAAHSYRITRDGVNSFDAVYRNIKGLQNKYPDYFSESVHFNAVLHNKNSMEGIHSFIRKEFGKAPKISELNNSGIKDEKKEEFYRTYRNKSESLLSSENYEKLSQDMFLSEPNTNDLLIYLHQYSGNVFKDYNSLFVDKSNIEYIPTGTCPPFSKKMFVTVNGKILQCERIDHNFTLGQITDKGVSLDFEAISARFNGYLGKIKKQCAHCYRNESCIQCIYYINDIDEENPVCHGYMNKEAFRQYSSHCINHLIKHPYLYKKLMTDITVE